MAKLMSRKIALTTVFLLVEIAASACDRSGARLTAPDMPSLSQSSPTLASNYAWQVSFTGSATCAFDWSWQLGDGSTLPGGTTACGTPTSGTGSIPPGATGVVVNGSLIDSAPVCGSDSKSVTKSFDGSGNLNITMNLSVGGSFRVIVPFGGTNHMACPSANASFSLTTS